MAEPYGSAKTKMVGVERFIGVEEARVKLGQLVEEIAESGEHVALTKRGRALAVLVSRDEYAQLKQLATEQARQKLAAQLLAARRQVQAAGLDPKAIDEAIRAARQAG